MFYLPRCVHGSLCNVHNVCVLFISIYRGLWFTSFLLLCKPLHFYPFHFYINFIVQRHIKDKSSKLRYIVSVFQIKINAINLSLDFFFLQINSFYIWKWKQIRFGERWSVPNITPLFKKCIILKSVSCWKAYWILSILLNIIFIWKCIKLLLQ